MSVLQEKLLSIVNITKHTWSGGQTPKKNLGEGGAAAVAHQKNYPAEK
jgi:hypothetical protein